jgi:type II secretory pathway component PulK
MEKLKAQMQVNDRNGERGAALITVIMISFLLLVAVAALLLEASTNTANVTDATAEEQAYYAAESGIQTAVNILRHKPGATCYRCGQSGDVSKGRKSRRFEL